MCASLELVGGVLSGHECEGLQAYLKPMPRDTYESTKCGYKHQFIRPKVSGLTSAAAGQCASDST